MCLIRTKITITLRIWRAQPCLQIQLTINDCLHPLTILLMIDNGISKFYRPYIEKLYLFNDD